MTTFRELIGTVLEAKFPTIRTSAPTSGRTGVYFDPLERKGIQHWVDYYFKGTPHQGITWDALIMDKDLVADVFSSMTDIEWDHNQLTIGDRMMLQDQRLLNKLRDALQDNLPHDHDHYHG